MVKILAACFLLISQAWSAQATEKNDYSELNNIGLTAPCTARAETPDGIVEPSVCELKLPRIKKISIDPPTSTATTPSDEPGCQKFRPTLKDIRRFLSRTGAVSEQDWMHHLDLSQCRASGFAELSDGRKATWIIHASRMGRFVFEDKTVIFMYCPDCNFKPFW